MVETRTRKDVSHDLIDALRSVGDAELCEAGFKRSKRSTNYVRDYGDARQTVAVVADYFPRYAPGAEIHIHPHVRLAIPSVSQAALEIVGGDESLLARAPEIILNQPIEFCAPKDADSDWYASGATEIRQHVASIAAFVIEWVVPFLDELGTPDDLIRMYESDDPRMMKQRHWYIFVAAAQLIRDDPKAGLAILESQLGKPGPRKRFAVAFESLAAAKVEAKDSSAP